MNNYTWIDDYILGLIDMYNSNDVYEIYDSIDIKIVELNKDNILLQGSDGFYQRNYFNQEVVYIRGDLDCKYKRFVLAHELGHAILHTEIYTAAFNRSLLNKGKLERQATYFALRLLDIQINSDNFEGFTLEEIAKALHISTGALILI